MEQNIDNNTLPQLVQPVVIPLEEQADKKVFIEANTIESNLLEIKEQHIIPVFVKDNEPLISHADFIEASYEMAEEVFDDQTILIPQVRVSHPVKGRIPDARDKPASQLQDWEKTIYYERMMFAIEVPSIQSEIDGNLLSLTIGGVKNYGADNLYSRNQSEQHFKIFVGFKNKVCSNMCIWTDGYMGDLKVKSIGQLKACIRSLIQSYSISHHLLQMRQLSQYSITEHQFAQIVGRCRMYQHLPPYLKSDIPQILFGDQQLASVVKDYFKDNSFSKDEHGNINLWRLYNLFTGANKSSYIDSFLDRSVNAYHLIEQIKWSLEGKQESWYLD